MQFPETIPIKEYLSRKSIPFHERNNELITQCLFNSCDSGRDKLNECHLYFSSETGQYDCKKCGEKGNIVTLAKHFGDSLNELKTNPSSGQNEKKRISLKKLIEKCHNDLPENIRDYLHKRGIEDRLIQHFMLGWGNFYGENRIVIPIKDVDGHYAYLKLRKDPFGKDNSPKYLFYPKGNDTAVFNFEAIREAINNDSLVICEGEFDCMVLFSKGIPAITSTTGVNSFKDEWIERIKDIDKIYVCFDNDEEGQGDRAAAKLIERLGKKLDSNTIFQIKLPTMNSGKDITDYFTTHNGDTDSFMYKLPEYKTGKRPIDASKFEEMTAEQIQEILGLTIKKDNENKIITFLCMLSAYTEETQFNISFNAPSSTGKSYIPTEISKLFPRKDIMSLAYSSPTSFFHDTGVFDKERQGQIIDLSKKIVIFLDQPHTQLLERLRPILSHDGKEIQLKITDKTQKYGTRTKTVFIKGYPAVIFCSASTKIDEQESTRFILLSPETSQEKIRNAVHEKIKRETNKEAYDNLLLNDAQRILLKERIQAIKNEKIIDIRINNPDSIENYFLNGKNTLKPRHQRDIGRFISLIKAFALLNLWFREREGGVITANEKDTEEAIKLWNILAESQEYNLPPYIFNLYKEVIVPAFNSKNKDISEGPGSGLTRSEISFGHLKAYGRTIQDWTLRQQVLPMLDMVGIIKQEPDINDKRKILIFPLLKINSE